jgi:hypothetical protein
MTARDAWRNVIKAGWWQFGSMLLLAFSVIAARTVFPSEMPVVVGAFVGILFLPPLICVLAVIGEVAATFRLSARENAMRVQTGNPLIDHGSLIGIGFVVLVVMGATLWVVAHQQ